MEDNSNGNADEGEEDREENGEWADIGDDGGGDGGGGGLVVAAAGMSRRSRKMEDDGNDCSGDDDNDDCNGSPLPTEISQTGANIDIVCMIVCACSSMATWAHMPTFHESTDVFHGPGAHR